MSSIEMTRPQPKRTPIIQVDNVVKHFHVGDEPSLAVRGVSLNIYPRDFTIIYGQSGSGKSTLLNLMIGLEQPTSGTVTIDGQRIDCLDEDGRAILRAQKFGVVYQQPIWVKALSVLENVALPLIIRGIPERRAYSRAKAMLTALDMERYANHKPTEVSGGQQQRISLVRALVTDPEVLVLDEPTGSLDTHTADSVMQLLQRFNVHQHRTIIMVTHNLIYLPYANRSVSMQDGRVDLQSSHTHSPRADHQAASKKAHHENA